MAVTAKLYREARTAQRYPSELGSTVRRGEEPVDATVLDLSTHGFSIEAAEELRVGDEISIGLSGIGRRTARVVWQEAGRFGCEFKQPLKHFEVADAFSATTVVAGPFDTPAEPLRAAEPALAPEPNVVRWPLRSRFAFMVGASAALWAAILTGVHALIA